MSATFDASLASAKDYVRLELGDAGDGTTQADLAGALLQDETITAAIGRLGYSQGVAMLAGQLARRFAQRTDTYEQAGGIKLSWKSRVATWLQLEKDARAGNLKLPPGFTRKNNAAFAGDLAKPDLEDFRSD